MENRESLSKPVSQIQSILEKQEPSSQNRYGHKQINKDLEFKEISEIGPDGEADREKKHKIEITDDSLDGIVNIFSND